MGLDMYLTKEIYIGANYNFNRIEGVIEVFKNGERIPIDFKKVSYITEEAIYWRKSNQIHKWFVDNVQDGNDDCGKYYVSTENLTSLMETIEKLFSEVNPYINLSEIDFEKIEDEDFDKKVNEHKEDIENICSKYLPSQSGCFFGGTSYNYYYFYDLDYTKEELNKLLKEENKHCSFYYTSSW